MERGQWKRAASYNHSVPDQSGGARGQDRISLQAVLLVILCKLLAENILFSQNRAYNSQCKILNDSIWAYFQIHSTDNLSNVEVRSVSDRLLSSSVGVESPLVSRELLEHVITIMAFTSLILVLPYCQSPLTPCRNKQRK